MTQSPQGCCECWGGTGVCLVQEHRQAACSAETVDPFCSGGLPTLLLTCLPFLSFALRPVATWA